MSYGWKRILLCGLLCCALLAGGASAAQFPDVPEDADYFTAVRVLTAIGIIQGDNKGNFNPDKTLTRAEAATILCRLMKVEDEAARITSAPFEDVPSDHWALGCIAKAAEMGLTTGYGDGTFGPGDTLTYDQFVTMLVNALGYGPAAQEAGGWPDGYTAVAAKLGVTAGVEAGEATRGLVAKLLFNTVKLAPLE